MTKPTEPPAPKLNHHLVIALRHMQTRREQLTAKIEALTKERDDLDQSIKVLQPE